MSKEAGGAAVASKAISDLIDKFQADVAAELAAQGSAVKQILVVVRDPHAAAVAKYGCQCAGCRVVLAMLVADSLKSALPEMHFRKEVH